MSDDQFDLPNYDESVGLYEQFAEPATTAFAPAMLRAAAIAPGERVLDVAAGTGALTLPLLTTGALVNAVDLSPPMVAHLAARLAHERRARVEVMDGQALDFPDEHFDVALSLFGVMLFPDFRAGLREMVRVVRPDGRCVVGIWAGYTAPMRLLHDAIAVALPDWPAPTPVPGMVAMASPAGLAAELELAGLRDIKSTSLTLPWPSPDRRGTAGQAARFFAQIPPWPQLSEDERARVATALRIVAERDADQPFDSTALVGIGHRPE